MDIDLKKKGYDPVRYVRDRVVAGYDEFDEIYFVEIIGYSYYSGKNIIEEDIIWLKEYIVDFVCNNEDDVLTLIIKEAYECTNHLSVNAKLGFDENGGLVSFTVSSA